jgi:hypothetical protein
MSTENKNTSAERVVRKNEKFNVPDQTEKEEAETHENASVENLADDKEIKRGKQRSQMNGS